MKISGVVVRYASPGCKEWAEGLEREVEFIDSDWAALGWALGSARVLFDYREAPVGSLADLPAVAQRFAESKRNGNWTWIFMFSQGLIYSDKFFRATNWQERGGCSLAVLGSISLGIVALLESRRRLKVPPSDDIIALIRFYKAELERVYYLRSPMWIIGAALTSYFMGLMLAERGGIRAHPGWDASLSLLWVSTMLFFLQTRRINRRRLERLAALFTEQR
jgi:hypothetical protein